MVWHTVPEPVHLLFPSRIWKEDSSENQVYLSFDDGPVPGISDFVVDELAKRSQKATFFMVGDNLRKHPELAKTVVDQGHRIGNHTFHHLNGWKTRDETYFENIRAFDEELESSLGIKTDLFRPPYGLIRRSQAKRLMETKKIVMWNVLSGDYDLDLSPLQVLKKTIQYTCAGCIILFHDQEKTKEVLYKILPDYLDFLKDNKFKTSTL